MFLFLIFGLKFAGMPSGPAFLLKVPLTGCTSVFSSITEAYLGRPNPGRAPGDFEICGFLGMGKNYTSSSIPQRSTLSRAGRRVGQRSPGNGGHEWHGLPSWLDGYSPGRSELYTASPLIAFENELGVPARAGLWELLAFTKDCDVELFKPRRVVQFKHGRVSMFATMVYIAAENVRFIGELSPSIGLQFSDVPNGLAAISKVALG